jgi:hypothetical protein
MRERIGEIVAETRVQGQRLAAVVASLHDSVDSAATAFDEKVAGSSNAFTAAVHEATTDVRAATADLRNTIAEAGEAISEASASFDRSVRVSATTFARHVDRAGTGFRTNAEEGGASVGAAAAGVQATIHRHAEIAELYRGCTGDLRESLQKLTRVVEANDRRILDLNVDGRKFVDVMGEVAQVLVAREQNLQAAEILFNEWLVRVSGAVETLATQVRAAATADIHEARGELREVAISVRTLVDERATVARQLETANDEARQTVDRLTAAASDQAAGAAELRGARSDLRDLEGAVRTLIGQLERARLDLGGSLHATDTNQPHSSRGRRATTAFSLWNLLNAIGLRRE